MISGLIQNVNDVPGVAGVCVFNKKLQLYPKLLPSFYIREVFADLPRRINSLFEAIDENYLPCDEYLLKFGEMSMYLIRGKFCSLVVFMTAEANFTTVKMISRIAVKNITPDMLLASMDESADTPPKPLSKPKGPTQSPIPPSSSHAPVRRRDDDDDDHPRKRHSYRGTSY